MRVSPIQLHAICSTHTPSFKIAKGRADEDGRRFAHMQTTVLQNLLINEQPDSPFSIANEIMYISYLTNRVAHEIPYLIRSPTEWPMI